MSRSLTLATALSCAVLIPGCTPDSAPTEPAGAGALGPSFRTGQNPNGPGAFVVRFEDVVALFFSGPDEAYSVIAGLSSADLAALCAGESFNLEPATDQLVFRPDGSIHQILRARNVTVHVFAGAFADFCGPALAVGKGNFTNTDNDLAVSFNRTNSFGFRLRGQVTDAGGDRHHLVAKFRALITRSGAFREILSDIKLN